MGNIAVFSSGSTGHPRLQSLSSNYMLDSNPFRDLVYEKFGSGEGTRVFYPAPVAAIAVVHFLLIAIGYVTVFSNRPTTTENMLDGMASAKADVLFARPSLIDRFISEGSNLPGVKTLVSSTGILKEKHLKYASSLGIDRVVDIYSTTETGVVGIRNAMVEEEFLVRDGLAASPNQDGTWVAHGGPGVGEWENGLVSEYGSGVQIDDIVKINNGKIKFISRSPWKVKVSGFTVSTPLVSEVLRGIPGINDAVVYARRDGDVDTLVAEYVGLVYNEDELRQKLLASLPFYCVPKVFENVSILSDPQGGLGIEHISIPCSD
jgi:acyl-coenzyme A synthetase/AMP-(fatty) acid ligase